MGKIVLWLQERIKFWTKPATSIIIIGTLLDLTRNRTDLVVENALLRQQSTRTCISFAVNTEVGKQLAKRVGDTF